MFFRNRLSTLFVALLIPIMAITFMTSCSQKQDHWGQKFEIEEDWWKKEGQSWNRELKLFMTIGYSNPSWKTKYDLRKSADLDARAQVATFMSSLVKNYMEEIRGHRYAISESSVTSSAHETVIGSVIVARKYKSKKYMSLIKVDLGYFFDTIYRKHELKMEADIRRRNRGVNGKKLNELIQAKLEKALDDLRTLEVPAIEKTIEESEKNEVSK
jgi:hypothetical protein